MTELESYGLTPLETASGIVLGVDGVRSPTATAGEQSEPLRALEDAVRPALQRPPCLVSFSGGRDSSAVLAVAASVARREGLPLPVPATNRFPAVLASDEADWQERVVAHLGLEDWARVEHRSELDTVGPVAREVLRRHGLLWPFNAHFHVPLLRLAGGGSLLTGIAGDETLSPRPWADATGALRTRSRPRARSALRIAFELAPAAVRRPVLRRRLPLVYPWLRPDAVRAVSAAWAAQRAGEPVGWAAHVRWIARLRYLRVGTTALALLARDEDVHLAHPFLDDRFAASLAALPRCRRHRTRADARRNLLGALLPDELLGRDTKSSFDGAFWGEPARAFAERWDGSGVDTALVDAGALRTEWLSEAPDPRSFTLAQAVWLEQARSAQRLEQQLESAR
jgi:asparagine synthetase B (glutamine-hydrolysing)